MRVRKRYHKRDRRIQRLYIADDPYVAGVLASKLGLVEYALAHAEVLSTAYCSREFRRGRRAACSWREWRSQRRVRRRMWPWRCDGSGRAGPTIGMPRCHHIGARVGCGIWWRRYCLCKRKGSPMSITIDTEFEHQ